MRYQQRQQRQLIVVTFLLAVWESNVNNCNNNHFGIVESFTASVQIIPKLTKQKALHETSALFMSEPSDTSSEDFTNEQYPGYGSSDTTTSTATIDVEGKETDVMVSNVMDLIPRGTGGFKDDGISNEMRSAINEALYKLEAINPTKTSPALSPLLNGVWELRYYGGYVTEGSLSLSPTRQLALFLYSGGYSPGLFGLYLASQIPSSNPIVSFGDVEIVISRIQPRVESTVPVTFVGGAESSIKITASLEPVSGMRLKEKYESVNVFGTTNVQLPTILQYSRDLFVTYVDEDIMIVRDGSGIPEVLIRKEKRFMSESWGTDPVTSDDVTPPGVDSSTSDEDGSAPSY